MSSYTHDEMMLHDLYYQKGLYECDYYAASDCNDGQGVEDALCGMESIQAQIDIIKESFNA